jgi:hypothetical protein
MPPNLNGPPKVPKPSTRTGKHPGLPNANSLTQSARA